MEAWLEFGRGPLFRISFTLMVLGLLRIIILQIVGMIEAYNRSSDKIVPWGDLWKKTFFWLIPIFSIWRKRPVYSLISVLFHIGLILVPLFLAAHVLMWKGSVGFGWFQISQSWADILTLVVIITGPLLFLMRVLNKDSRFLSRAQDFILPLLLTIPFITGYVCVNSSISATGYQVMMFFHLYVGNLLMIMVPFTKIAHCVLMPFSQFVTGVGWKFPKGAGDKIIATLGYAEKPTWFDEPRIGIATDAETSQEDKKK
ncbi:MAG: hypothetical protein HQ568_02245 [Calditrichaeota bacterium]|nr:hypothetical protein [Calditrichota bacterium]